MTNEELLNHATQFEFPGGARIMRSPFIYPQGSWYIKRDDDILDREKGWRLYNQVEDGNFLFASAMEAASFLVSYQEKHP